MRPDAARTSGIQIARVIGLITVVALGAFLWIACEPTLPLPCRIGAGLAAVLCIALPARILYAGARRYRRTGHWSMQPEDRAAFRQGLAARPSRPWLQALMTGLLIAVGLLNVLSTTLGEHRHHNSGWNALVLGFWAVFLLAQGRKLRRELRQRNLQTTRA